MAKIAFLFPGQGSQYVGMGREFFEKDSVNELFHEADKILGINITELCLNGPNEKLCLTENTQPAILLISAAAHKILTEKGVCAEFAAGHSLGEYSALLAAGSIRFEEAISLVQKRGRFMQEAAPVGSGGMVAVIGLQAEKVDELCESLQPIGYVKPANYNSPEQVVVAGEKKAVGKFSELAAKEGAKKIINLSVSAPFHTRLMKKAEEKLTMELDETKFDDLNIPVITNVDATPVTNGAKAKDALRRQVCAPVRWVDSMQYLLDQGVDTFIEIGPGRVLGGLIKRIERKAKCLNVEDRKSLEKTLNAL